MSLGLLGQYSSGSESDITDSDEELQGRGQIHGIVDDSDLKHTAIPAPNEDQQSGRGNAGGSSALDCRNTRGRDPLDWQVVQDETSDGSSSESAESDEDSSGTHTLLPLPDLDKGQQLTSSVFSNPYKEAEEAQLAVLKQHVDFDTPQSKRELQDPRKFAPKSNSYNIPAGFEGEDTKPGDELFDDKDSSVKRITAKRKHRGGVGNSLAPSKKFMKLHQQIQAKERPWTLQK